MGRTRSSTLALVAAATGAVTWGVLSLLDSRGTHLAPVLWVVAPILVVVAALVLWAASAVRSFLRGRRPSLDPIRAARTAALAKASSLTGALLAGWYAGQALLTLPHLQVEAQQGRAWSAGAAAVAAVVLAVAGLVAERFCELPPPGDGEPTQMREDGAHD